jgi:hypothetical protein
MHRLSRLLSGTLAAGFAATASLAEAPNTDWGERTIADARAFHAEQAASHPGPANPADPGFSARLDSALATALRRAASVTTAGGYMAALREMTAGFNDGHMYIGFADSLPVNEAWPGFVARWRDDALTITATAPDVTTPKTGDRVISCDGRDAAALAAELVAPWQGSWDLVAEREQQGWRVFFDEDNPFVQRPQQCRFEGPDGRRKARLAWRPIPDGYRDMVARANATASAPIEARRLAGGLWISAGSFNGNGGPGDQALPALVKAVAAEAAFARSAPVLVLDMRGNGGGSSDWGVQLARIVWGAGPVDRVRAADNAMVHTDWRASAANLAAIDGFCGPVLEASDASAEVVAFCKAGTTGLRAAYAAGTPLWREPDLAPPALPAGTTPAARTGPTFLLVDGRCASACLDTVDLWTALGAKVIGRTTGADSSYMEVRTATVPSGLADYAVPMKVYSGRARGSGVPVQPVHRFNGDMGDMAALEAWVRSLLP